MTALSESVKLFYSYAHEDERYRQQLGTHLAGLKQQVFLEDWHDRKIVAGQDWEEAIHEKLETSDIIILLVTPDFLASEYCFKKEMNRALEKHKAGEATVIPVIVRPSYWEIAPLNTLQALPRDAKPVVEWRNRDRAWLNVVEGIHGAIKGLPRRVDKRKDPTYIEHDKRMILKIEEPGLQIYLTGPGVGWEKNPLLRYAETPEGYRVSVNRGAIGAQFKHFVVCNTADGQEIKQILARASCAVTGRGDPDDENDRWRVWFLLRNYPATRGYEDPSSNNLWS